MKGVYTCVCGVQLWTIHEDFIRCGCCKREYKHQTNVEKFNKNMDKRNLGKKED